jgi:hypothetical protein
MFGIWCVVGATVQSNGSTFTDAAGKQDFEGPGEIGMLDWGAYTPTTQHAAAKGVKALLGEPASERASELAGCL